MEYKDYYKILGVERDATEAKIKSAYRKLARQYHPDVNANDTLAEENKYLSLAAGNIPSVKLLLPTNLNVKDLLEADVVVMTEKAVNDITERLQ